MNAPTPARRTHDHSFQTDTQAAEAGTRLVTWITLAMMVVEIAAGWWFNSMALLADGLHMSSHALAIGLAAFAYAMARRHARDTRYAFGTYKIEVLAGFSSALFLLMIAAAMFAGSVERIFAPQDIAYVDAIWVALIGLLVNVACALVLARAAGHHHHHHHPHDSHDHDHGHDHESHHDHHHHDHDDLNLKAAYVHVIADAATSVLAIVALLGGLYFGWRWLDPLMGIAGALLVAVWAKNILKETGKVLLDREMDHPLVGRIRGCLEQRFGERIAVHDLHVWRIGRAAYACIISLESADTSLTPDGVREALQPFAQVVHATVEINRL